LGLLRSRKAHGRQAQTEGGRNRSFVIDAGKNVTELGALARWECGGDFQEVFELCGLHVVLSE
jgi:hypothetical protein